MTTKERKLATLEFMKKEKVINPDKYIPLDYFLTKEDDGVVFCKIAKNPEVQTNNTNCGKFNYHTFTNSLLDCTNTDDFTDNTTSIGPLDFIAGLSHYGNELVVFSFHKLKDEIGNTDDFIALENNSHYKQCFDVSHVWVKEIKPMHEPTTIEYIFDYFQKMNIDSETIQNVASQLQQSLLKDNEVGLNDSSLQRLYELCEALSIPLKSYNSVR